MAISIVDARHTLALWNQAPASEPAAGPGLNAVQSNKVLSLSTEERTEVSQGCHIELHL